MFGMGMQELIILGVIAVLLFGKRLPDVAKSLGSSYREFRKGLTDLQSQVDFRDTFSSSPSSSYKSPYKSPGASSKSSKSYDDYEDYDEASAPRFVPPPAAQEVESAPASEGVEAAEGKPSP